MAHQIIDQELPLEIEIVYGGDSPIVNKVEEKVSIITKATVILPKITLSRSSDGADSNEKVERKKNITMNGTKCNVDRKSDDESNILSDENCHKDISRRLVEYFVVVSSVPKSRPSKEGVQSIVVDGECRRKTPLHRSKSVQLATNADVPKSHLSRYYSGGIGSGNGATAPNDFRMTPDTTQTMTNNQKKKSIGSATIPGLHNLEKKLETFKLEKTLSKLKSIAHHSTSKVTDEKKSKQSQHDEDDDDDDSSSSAHSASSLEITPNTTECPSFSNVEGSTFRPSMNPLLELKTNDAALAPLVQPPSEGPPRSAPLPTRQTSIRGASENIRIGHEQDDIIDDFVLEPVITAKYPPIDHSDQPLNPMIPKFCHPQGSGVIVPTQEYKMPTVHYFVLTDSKGGKLYGTCLTVHEEISSHSELEIMSGECNDLDHSMVGGQERGFVECTVNNSPKVVRSSHRNKGHRYYAPRVLCLLSTWPYLSAFRTYLTQLYKLATATNLMTEPLERYILNICSEVPAPPPGSFEVNLSILDTNIRFWAPPADQPIAYVSLPYGILFECLDIDNVLFAWYTLACERKILLVSSQQSLLTVCAEILCSMLFPMKWSHLYIPCLPRFLTPMLDAPMPYLIGISRENFPHAMHDISDETVVVDLDRNVITTSKHTPELPILPHRRKTKLEAALMKHAGDVYWKARGVTASEVDLANFNGDKSDMKKLHKMAGAVWEEKICSIDEAFNLAHTPDSMCLLYSQDQIGTGADAGQSRWDAVQEAFLRFYVSMLKDYRKFMPTLPKEQQSWRGPGSVNGGRFLASEFVQSQPLDFQPFLEELIGTQQFDDFVTRRMYNAGKAPDVTFFDQSIDAKLNRSKLKLKKTETSFLHSANAHRNLKRIDAVQPNRANLPSRSRFDTNYDLKKGVYTYPTWPETFDGSLFGKPRPIPRIITAEFDRRAALTRMLGVEHRVTGGRSTGDHNPSPEATAFVIFFITFSATIGSEWASIERNRTNGGNILDQCTDSASNVSSVSGEPWTPKVNPPWMEGDNFLSLHRTFRPLQSRDPPVMEDIVYDDDVAALSCPIDCADICGDVSKAIGTDAFVGNPWSRLPSRQENPIQLTIDEDITKQLTMDDDIAKARAIAKAQIDLGFNTLRMMRRRKLPSESITYKTLIEACGRCGIAHRAQQLMEMMTQDGFSLDSEVYYAFVNAFSHLDSQELTPLVKETDTASEISAEISANLSYQSESSGLSFLNTSKGESERSLKSMMRTGTKFMNGVQNAMSSTIAANRRAYKSAKRKRTKRFTMQKLTKKEKLRVTSAITIHLQLSYCILDDLYPGIKIDADSDTCPKCSRVLDQDHVIAGWNPCQVNDFTTLCPSCKHRFVPKFSVACNLETFEGSQGAGTPLYCDYLSPWVLLREIRSLVTPTSLVGGKAAKVLGVESDVSNSVGIDTIIDPQFREGSGLNATLWWNMIVTFMRFKIPFTYLLQGSYEHQQLIMPTMTDTT